MSLIRTTNRLWLPFISMLISASVTSSVFQADRVQPGQVLPNSTATAPCCLDNAVNTSIVPASQESGDVVQDAVIEADLWTRMRDGFVFPSAPEHAIQSHLKEYANHSYHLRQILRRGEPYLFHIVNRLEQAGMPTELALLPVIESAFDPLATSPVGAAGIWQFMPHTAADVGLGRNWWYDGRLDIVAATEAALGYLEKLNNRFDGDWFLALAAYNAGSARVRRAIRRNREAGKPVDFWNLTLPDETRDYVPKLIALRTIIDDPRRYNIALPELPDTQYFSRVRIDGQIGLNVAARLSGVSLNEIQRLNPAFARSITPPDKSHEILVPRLSERRFRERIAQLPKEQFIQAIRHRIDWGDNLSTIAQQYRTTVPELRKMNRLTGNKIIAGDTLIVPVALQMDTLAAGIPSAQL